MKLAEQMSCSVEEAKGRVTRWELNAWIAYWDLRREAEAAAAKGKDPVEEVRRSNQAEQRRKRGRR